MVKAARVRARSARNSGDAERAPTMRQGLAIDCRNFLPDKRGEPDHGTQKGRVGEVLLWGCKGQRPNQTV